MMLRCGAIARAWLLAGAVALSGAAPVAAEVRIERPHQVVDPGYGAVLFQYYQKNWFAAMTEALMALEVGTLPTQRDQARVLLGALYAHYGMPVEAETLFNELLDGSIDSALAPAIWLHLAELHYRQQRYHEVLDLLDRRIGTPPAELANSYHALRTRTLMRLGLFEQTSEAMTVLDGSSLSGYLRYNLAVSRINAGQGAQGEALLWQVANLPPGDDETNALKDRAMLALGVHYLRSGDEQRARDILRASRLSGPFSETALLLHARAWLNSGQPRRALGSLDALSKRSLQHEETQEALLSLPWLYQNLGDHGRAAEAYRNAVGGYTEHYRYLAGLEQRIRAGQWFAELVQEPVWSTAMDSLPTFKPARVESFATFRQLFASHAFHSRWRDYHEQLRQIHLLGRWQQRLPAVEAMVEAQIRKHRDQVPQAKAMLAALEAAGWPAKRDQLQQRFAAGKANNDLRMFASAEELRLLDAVADAEQRIRRWPDRVKPELVDKLALSKGALLWQLQENSVERHWQRERALRDLQPLLADMSLLSERVAEAAAGDGHRAITLGHQLAGMYNALASLEQRGEQLRARLQQQIEALALARIEHTRRRLLAFTAEAWAGLGDLQNGLLRDQRRWNGKASGDVGSDENGSDENSAAQTGEGVSGL